MNNERDNIIQFPEDKAKKKPTRSMQELTTKKLIPFPTTEFRTGNEDPIVEEAPLIVRYDNQARQIATVIQKMDAFPFPNPDEVNGELTQVIQNDIIEEIYQRLCTMPYDWSMTAWMNDARVQSNRLVKDTEMYSTDLQTYFAAKPCTKTQINALIKARKRGISFRRDMDDFVQHIFSMEKVREKTVARKEWKDQEEFPLQRFTEEFLNKKPPTWEKRSHLIGVIDELANEVVPVMAGLTSIALPPREALEALQNRTDLAIELREATVAMTYPSSWVGWVNSVRIESSYVLDSCVDYYAYLAPLTVLSPKDKAYWEFLDPAKRSTRNLLTHLAKLREQLAEDVTS